MGNFDAPFYTTLHATRHVARELRRFLLRLDLSLVHDPGRRARLILEEVSPPVAGSWPSEGRSVIRERMKIQVKSFMNAVSCSHLLLENTQHRSEYQVSCGARVRSNGHRRI
jgi:hypothetical protein